MDLDAQIESAHFVSQHHYNPQEDFGLSIAIP
jgi:hypothetical protein